MKRFVLLVSCLLLSTVALAKDPATPEEAGLTRVSSGYDSCARAFQIPPTNHRAGIEAEYKWIEKNLPGFKLAEQKLIQCDNGRPADVMVLVHPEKKIYTLVVFDISKFFGKF